MENRDHQQETLSQGAKQMIVPKNEQINMNLFEQDSESVESGSASMIRVEGSVLKIKFSIYISDGSEIENQLFADSLVGMDELMKSSSKAFFELLSIDSKRASAFRPTVYIDKVREGSKITEFVLELLSDAPDLIASVGSDLLKVIDNHSTAAVFLAIALILGKTAMFAIDRYTSRNVKTTTINITDSVVNESGNLLMISKESAERILSTHVPKRAGSAKAVAKVFGPAKRRSKTKFKVGGSNGIEIPMEIVEAVPHPEDIQNTLETKVQDFDHVRIDFAAMDRDRKNRGWAAVLPEGMPGAGRRFPVTLEDTVNPNELMYAKDAEVDLSVIEDSNGKPKSVRIRKLHRGLKGSVPSK